MGTIRCSLAIKLYFLTKVVKRLHKCVRFWKMEEFTAKVKITAGNYSVAEQASDFLNHLTHFLATI